MGVAAHHTFAETADNSLDYILNKGVLLLGLDPAFPPMGYMDEQGDYVGYDLDVAAEVCARLGVVLEPVPIDWDAKEQMLAIGDIDCIWNGFSVNAQRQESLSLSLSYLLNDQVLVVRAADGIASVSDLAGKTLALQAGSTAEDALNEPANADVKALFKDVLMFEDNAIALEDLAVGGVDAVLLDKVVAEYYITEKQAPFVVLSESLLGEEYAIGFRKGDVALTEAVNAILLDMAADGTLGAITEKWFGADVSLIGK